MDPERLAELREAMTAADSILSLLHHRGLVDSQDNREDVAAALLKVRRFESFYLRRQPL